jgi:hypothetical protein
MVQLQAREVRHLAVHLAEILDATPALLALVAGALRHRDARHA